MWIGVGEILESVDNIYKHRLLSYMLRSNIVIEIDIADSTISEIPREHWIGREYAFQIPAYYYILKTAVRKKSWEISPEDVIREAVG
jgi:hypothetical protein